MGKYKHQFGRGPEGQRKYNALAAAADRYAREYRAAQAKGTSPSIFLSKLKKAARYMGVPRNVVSLMDKLVAHSRPQDWAEGAVPIVWPGNEELSLDLGVGIRQVKNITRAAIEFGLITTRDSANGNRRGTRDKNGNILWAYGFDLRPLGRRADEFDAIAARGQAEDKEIKRLRCEIRATRKLADRFVAAAAGLGVAPAEYETELELIKMACAHISGSRDIEQLCACVAQVHGIAGNLRRLVDATMAEKANEEAGSAAVQAVEKSPEGEMNCPPNTTTRHLTSAKAPSCNGLASLRSAGWDVSRLAPKSNVEDDLDRHGVTPTFVATACPSVVWELDLGPRAWGRLVSIAEGLVGQHDIAPSAWREACRLMGQRGAAAAVISTVQKLYDGEVLRAGAYLRGLNGRAAEGELNIGKTFHGLRERAQNGRDMPRKH